MRKSRILASENPSQTLPKSFQNRCSEKQTNFHRFLLDFFVFLNLRFLKNVHFTLVKSLFSRFSLKSCFYISHVFSIQKTYQKPFQDDVRTYQKTTSKTCCFFTSIFSGLGLDFGGSWSSKLEPSWLKMPPPTVR